MASSTWDKMARAQWQRSWRLLLAVYIPVGVLLMGIAALKLAWDVPIADLTRDPISVAESMVLDALREPGEVRPHLEAVNFDFYLGFVSNLGIIGWATATVVGLWSAALLRRMDGENVAFFFLGGLLSAVLLIDDFFLIHERAVPLYLGIEEKAVFAVHGLVAMAWLIAGWQQLRDSAWLVALSTAALMAASLVVDQLPIAIPQPHLFEDGGKFAGIVAWAAYLTHTAWHALAAPPTERTNAPPRKRVAQ